MAESFGGWDGDGVAGGQQAGEECAESEEGGGCETACGKGTLTVPVDTGLSMDYSSHHSWSLGASTSSSTGCSWTPTS